MTLLNHGIIVTVILDMGPQKLYLIRKIQLKLKGLINCGVLQVVVDVFDIEPHKHAM